MTDAHYRFPRGPKSEVRVSLDQVEGRPPFLNVRLWFLGTDGAWHPTRRGVTFPVDELADLGRVVTLARVAAKGTTA